MFFVTLLNFTFVNTNFFEYSIVLILDDFVVVFTIVVAGIVFLRRGVLAVRYYVAIIIIWSVK